MSFNNRPPRPKIPLFQVGYYYWFFNYRISRKTPKLCPPHFVRYFDPRKTTRITTVHLVYILISVPFEIKLNIRRHHARSPQLDFGWQNGAQAMLAPNHTKGRLRHLFHSALQSLKEARFTHFQTWTISRTSPPQYGRNSNMVEIAKNKSSWKILRA